MLITILSSDFEKVESRTRIRNLTPDIVGHYTKWSVFHMQVELIEMHRMTPKSMKSDVVGPRYRPRNIAKP